MRIGFSCPQVSQASLTADWQVEHSCTSHCYDLLHCHHLYLSVTLCKVVSIFNCKVCRLLWIMPQCTACITENTQFRTVSFFQWTKSKLMAICWTRLGLNLRRESARRSLVCGSVELFWSASAETSCGRSSTSDVGLLFMHKVIRISGKRWQCIVQHWAARSQKIG